MMPFFVMGKFPSGEAMRVPLYSYRCEKCDITFEELVSMDRRDEVVCPECGGEVRRAYEGKSAFGVDFSKNKCAYESSCAASGCGCGCKCGR